jgi:hypothetical protein
MTGVVLWIALVVAIALIGSGLHDLLRDRSAMLTRFGERFVREFDRPLVRVRPREPGIEARLRVRPHRAQVEVLLAPRGGRPYPNSSITSRTWSTTSNAYSGCWRTNGSCTDRCMRRGGGSSYRCTCR